MKVSTVYESPKDAGAIAGLSWLIKSLFHAYANRLTEPPKGGTPND